MQSHTSFVGRDRELQELEGLIAANWLVTVMGPPGVGKTRLTHEMAKRFTAPVVWCELRGCHGQADVFDAMTRSLGVSSTEEGVDDMLGRAIRARGKCLLVLDNGEQVAASLGKMVSKLHELAPDAAFLVTSRERLQVPGEVLFRLGPLSLPSKDEDLPSSHAVTLFVERTQHLRPDFSITAANAADVATIVRVLDGLPLAIELAAGRMAVLGPRQLAELLSGRFDVLTESAGPADLPTRSLREAIGASFESLSSVEQQVFAQCAVFAGSFDLRAAEAVVDLPPQSGSPLGILQALHDRSLITTFAPRPFDTDLRFGFYTSIHEYAKQRMEALCDVDSLLSRHAKHFGRWGRQIVEDKRDEQCDELASALEIEETNLVQALEWAALDVTSAGSAEPANTALELALVLDELLDLRGTMHQRRRVLDAGLAVADECAASARLLVQALCQRSHVRSQLAMPEGSLEDSQRALELAEKSGTDELLCRAKLALGSWHMWASEAPSAIRLLTESVAIARKLGKTELEGLGLQQLGYVESWSVSMSAARDRFALAVSAHRRGRHLRQLGVATTECAACSRELGHLSEAREQFHQALEVLGGTRSRRLMDYARSELAWLCLELSDPLAEGLIREALSGARLGGSQRVEAVCLTELGIFFELEGKPQQARHAYEEALQLQRRPGGNRRLECINVASWARLEADEDRVDRALEELDRAVLRLESLGDRMSISICDVARGHVDLARARAAAARGDVGEAQAHLASAHSRMTIARSPMPDGRPAIAAISTDARLFLRLLERCISRFEQVAPEVSAPRGPKLDLHTSERCVVLPDGVKLQLRTRGSLWRIVEHLATEHGRTRGKPVPARALFNVGWPGQQAQPDAATHRVYEALYTLRKMGLHDFIVRTDEGYCFQANVTLTIHGETEAPPEA